MNVLYITAACLSKNTSANMSHNGYVQGLLENGADLDIIMANDSWGEADQKMQRWPQAEYYVFNATSLGNHIKSLGKRFSPPPKSQTVLTQDASNHTPTTESKTLRNTLKKVFYKIFRQDPLYPLNATWLRNASRFRSEKYYDLVVTNSSPSASHKLMSLLKASGRISFNHWIQIWEDPWYDDLYGNHSELVKAEEASLLQDADEIYYVSPLTLHYQKILFPASAQKMKCIPLPFLKFSNDDSPVPNNDAISFGYFGDYYSHTRNLLPFYNAIARSGFKGHIYGDSDLSLASTEKVTVSRRVTLDVLERVQKQTDILVHLCNLSGGQIPGKIYHYSATNKPILFILDGTAEERKIIHKYFEKFNRYVFCENTEESIGNALCELTEHFECHIGKPILSFSPKEVVKQLFEYT